MCGVGSKNEICVTQTGVTGNGDCCKPWCWVSEEDCPTARYNKEADKFYSCYDACPVRRRESTTAERKTGIKTSNLGTSCANRNIETLD